MRIRMNSRPVRFLPIFLSYFLFFSIFLLFLYHSFLISLISFLSNSIYRHAHPFPCEYRLDKYNYELRSLLPFSLSLSFSLFLSFFICPFFTLSLSLKSPYALSKRNTQTVNFCFRPRRRSERETRAFSFYGAKRALPQQ